jgi:hypothetical protein
MSRVSEHLSLRTTENTHSTLLGVKGYLLACSFFGAVSGRSHKET